MELTQGGNNETFFPPRENRRIENTPLVLVIDGIWLRLKNTGKCVLLCTVEIDKDGIADVLHFEIYPEKGEEELIGSVLSAVKKVPKNC